MAQPDQNTRNAVDALLQQIPRQHLSILREHLVNLHSGKNPLPGTVKLSLKYGRPFTRIVGLLKEVAELHEMREEHVAFWVHNDLTLVA